MRSNAFISATPLHCCSSAANMLKLLFCLRTFTEFHSHFHVFILTKQTINNTDCGEGIHFNALVCLSFILSFCVLYFVFENVYLHKCAF